MISKLIDFIGDWVEITGNSTVDSILFSVIGIISFLVAFGFVGMLFDAFGHYDSDLMSDTHWIVRLIVFCALTFGLVKLAQLIKWLFSFAWWVYVIFFAVVIAVIFCIFYFRSKNKAKKTENEAMPDTETVTETAKEENVTSEPIKAATFDRYHCPRCHANLVKRHGPYGDFYGCESYGKTGCRYTRKYL